ncbi:MAG TPA: tripartite tricarboxylate transporter substrate binding protein [Falsiroseomonas sp.]|jgi:tripartite-type tricarboxylate transporter receptor subunit TctC|nr:tripartite tricarboxylate transporter substrate binding protein [Falsiroseomonas sp.]
MTTRRNLALIGIAGLATAAAPRSARTQADRLINLIVPFAPGGGTDLSARLIAPYIERHLGTRIVILNRAGAGGQIGATQIARARPDGTTIGFMNVPNTMMKPHERDAGYTVDSFEPIANLVSDPAVLAVRADSPFRTLADAVAAARARPDHVTVGSAGVGSNTHLDLIQLERAASVRFDHIPYDGGAAPRTALLAGQVQVLATALGDVFRFMQDGTIRSLGILSAARSPLAPQIPTYREEGFDAIGGASRGLVGPRNMPRETVEAIASAAERALREPELIAAATNIALTLAYMGPEEYGRYLRAADADLARVWRETPWVARERAR